VRLLPAHMAFGRSWIEHSEGWGGGNRGWTEVMRTKMMEGIEETQRA
jgi:hypothetical protein